MQEAVFVLTYDAFPICGDGVEVSAALYANGELNATTWLMQQAHEPQRGSKPVRNKVQQSISLQPGDQIDILVEPRQSHDCDGIFIVELEIWQSRGHM